MSESERKVNPLLAVVNTHISMIAFFAVLLLWELACRGLQIPQFVLPAPSSIAGALIEVGAQRWFDHAFATLSVALAGYGCAILVALPLAIGIVNSEFLSRLILPWLVVVQSTPIIAVAPIIVVTLGTGHLPKVVITMLITFFPLVISAATGLASAPSELVELSRSLRAPVRREYLQIRIPYAMPYLFSALKVGITLSIIGAVVAEFVAAELGLGYLILFSTSSFKVPVAFAALAILVLTSLTLYGLVAFLPRRFFPWGLKGA